MFQQPQVRPIARIQNNALTLRKAASQHGSQTSGTSVSRSQRQRASLRRVMEIRLTRPLQAAWHTGALIVVFLAALIIGFVLCLNFMALSNDSIATDFTQTRIGRRAVIRMVEGIRQMAYGSAINSNIEYQAGVATVRTNYNAMVATVLPILNRLEAANFAKTPHFRLYNRIVVNATRIDYVPIMVSPTELSTIVLQAGALALGYTANGTLTPLVANTVSEFSFLFENLFGILAASKELPVTGIRAYNQIGAEVSMYLIIIMVVSLLALFAVGLIVYFRVTLAYFRRESQVHGLLLGIHTKIASGLVTNMDEEIESFREIIQEDEAQELDHSLIDLTNGGSGVGSADAISGDAGVPTSGGGSFGGKGSRSSAAAKATGRQQKFVTPLLACVIGIGAIVVALFTVTLSSLQVEVDLQRLLDVSDRRYYANAMRVTGREAVAGPLAGFVQTESLIQNLRTYLVEADEIHQRLLKDPTGLSIQVPELTALPRNCTLPTSCNFVPENPAIGFTRTLASLPFNIEFTRLLDTGRYFVDQLLDVNARQTIRTSEAFMHWQLMEAISLDIEDRCRELEIGAQARLIARLAIARSWIMVTFVLLIVASVAAFAYFVLLGVNTLKREAAGLVLLLHMVPTSAFKDMPELAHFLETGGLTLMT
ncbi:hypothetical protein BCR44DRAFT_1265138 [Catenaria anguillulae PL171]|uniref:Uncharacterized protein n=1 Tax=Catenaria anguillulae PL171 TaxID=765915 RepID=A0A1Y2HA59_9FUNG|nr:hypothetical protein BCR44DRAFT_1265138 [Catenaria anguillulae PL171]